MALALLLSAPQVALAVGPTPVDAGVPADAGGDGPAEDLVRRWRARPLGAAPARGLRAEIQAYAAARPADAAAAAWLAQAHYWEGLQEADEGAPEDVQLRAYEAGASTAARAQRMDPRLAAAFFWDGVNTAKVAEIRGIARSVALLPRLRSTMDRVDALERGHFFGGTARFRGAVITRTPSMLVTLQGGSHAEGERFLAQSVREGPTFVGTRRFQAELAEKQGRRAQAVKILEEALVLQDGPDPDEAAWNRHERHLCQLLLSRLRGRP